MRTGRRSCTSRWAASQGGDVARVQVLPHLVDWLPRRRCACRLPPLARLCQCSVGSLVHVLVDVLDAVNGGADVDVDVAPVPQEQRRIVRCHPLIVAPPWRPDPAVGLWYGKTFSRRKVSSQSGLG